MSASRDRRSSPEPSSSTSPVSYVYCKPTVLQTDGYAYGKTNLEGAGVDSVSVTRVASGRWAELPEIMCTCLRRDVQGRTVEAEEAASGIGTYVGSCVCVARLLPGSAKVWSYGVVTDYTWNGRGLLHVCFGADSSSIEFNTSELQVLPLPVYALRPCAGVPVLTLMGAEMRSRHGAVLDHFNGTGCRASRNSASILRKVGVAPVDETTMIPVFDFSRCCVQSTSLKYVLDFSYYHGNSRRRPQSVILGATILDEPQRTSTTVTQVQETLGAVEEEVTGQAAAQMTPAPRTTSAARTEFLPGQLSDSDDSDGEETDPAPLQEVTLLPSAERKRPLEVAMTESGETASLKLLKRSYSDNPSMLRSIDQLIALRASSVSAGAVSDVIGPTISPSGKSKQQFQPSVLQRSIHRHLVTGTYALMDAQLLLETLQVQHLLFAFLLHPAILRALFSWEFWITWSLSYAFRASHGIIPPRLRCVT
ncbi:hypothetical protein PF005_g23199 [Phytophthora fragariae]|uniref:Uncharacterized protein n=3 Tax=Phytophthora fragariae TaxID=53985 RepID=A0A6A3DXW6_9STRA|nr:hypothetical protein PF003_g13308 [Phytophthora fragariae]KAE8923360.1 hypothetical protein PF009_g26388 [Phytophthora fragariae]KAE9072432.1 hypothetical protein PF007_g26182 [Phytophthora fragariae]KAE9092132.1 hypothetical protein PF006_g24767 [Phytophthora fragariae]KAE9180628.1 hypothetical protein PF005_g23199 [Phytophthora fragariae]